MKETLTVKEVRQILKIGSNTAYSLIHSKSFPVKRVGHSYRIPTEPFYRWLEGQRLDSVLWDGVGQSTAAQS